MQYPVPQFTDVEDKIIGPLTLKQAGIVGGAGFLIFFIFSATKSVAALVIGILFLGLPAVGVAFVKLNGRPIYNNFVALAKYFINAKSLVFHKEGYTISDEASVETLEVAQPDTAGVRKDTSAKLKKLNYLLQEQARAQEELLGQPRQ